MMTKIIVPTGAMLVIPTFIPKLYANEAPCEKCKMKRLPKASELSLYESQSVSVEEKPIVQEPGSLEYSISLIHKKISKYFGAVDVFWNRATEIINTGVAHSRGTYDYLRQEENVSSRVLAIAAGGLAGLLIAVRGKTFKKIAYSSIGASTIAAACYPNEAKEYVQWGYSVVSNKTSSILKEHTGYDIEKLKSDTKDKVGSFKDNLNFPNITNSVKEQFNKIYPVEKMAKNKVNSGEPVEDHGQSNPTDADLYTTRS